MQEVAASSMGRLNAQIPNEDPARLARIQDAKWRTIGVDKAALDLQAQEHLHKEEREAQRDREYAARAQYYDDIASTQQLAADQARRQWNADVQQFRRTFQGVHTTTEWDLNRPDRLALDRPARLGDDDPSCGPASLQRFDGEDLGAADRSIAQQEQCSAWWQAQNAAHAAKREAERVAKAHERELVMYQDEVQRSAAAQEAAMRTANSRAVAEANARLTAARRARDAAAAAAEEARSSAEVAATVADPYLTEDPAMAASALAPGRVRRDHWKGMSDAQRRAIAATQLQQVEEHRLQAQRDAQEEAEYAALQAQIGRSMARQAYQVADFKAQMSRQAGDFLRRQMIEKEARDSTIKALYTNTAAPAYFQQFGTSHR